jgi:hypothetical protein
MCKTLSFLTEVAGIDGVANSFTTSFVIIFDDIQTTLAWLVSLFTTLSLAKFREKTSSRHYI